MKRTILWIVVFAVIIGIGTAASLHAFDGRSGYKAPMFRIESTDTIMSLDDMRGNWVLLQFWSSSDAPSRLSLHQYTDLAQQTPQSPNKLHYVAVNMDRTEGLFREISRIDGIDPDMQFHVSGDKAARLKKDYNMQQGLHSFLIDPDGKIVAVDPTKQELVNHNLI